MKIIVLSPKLNTIDGRGHETTLIPELVKSVGSDHKGVDIFVVGGKGQSHEDWFLPFLPNWKLRDTTRLNPNIYVEKISSEIREFIREEKTLIHVYEGGFLELLIVLRLLATSNNIIVDFNFNLTDPWHRTLSVKNSSRWLNLAKVIDSWGPRLRIFAETEYLAGRVSRFTQNQLSPRVYPMFSAIPAKQESSGNKVGFEGPYLAGFVVGSILEELVAINLLKKISPSSESKFWVAGRWGYLPKKKCWPKEPHQNNIVFIDKELPLDDYAQLHNKTENLILVYLSRYYLWSSSGRAIDGLASGCTVTIVSGASKPLRGVTSPNLRIIGICDKLILSPLNARETPKASLQFSAANAADRIVARLLEHNFTHARLTQGMRLTGLPKMSAWTNLMCVLREKGVWKF